MTKTYILDSVAQAVSWTIALIENNAVVSGGTSATDVATIPAAATNESAFAWTSPPGEPDNATWPSGTYNCEIDIAAVDANLTYPDGASGFWRVNGAADAVADALAGNWSATSGTGVITMAISWTPTGSTQTDRVGFLFAITNSNGHNTRTITLNLGTTTEFIDGPWTLPPARVPYRSHLPQLLAH